MTGRGCFRSGALRPCPDALGSRAHLLVAFSEPQDEQGLREVVRHWGGVHLCSNESFDGEALSSLMRLFGRFLEEFFSETRGTEGSNLPHTYSAA